MSHQLHAEKVYLPLAQFVEVLLRGSFLSQRTVSKECREREEGDEANESRGPVGEEECGEEVRRQRGGEQVV